MRPVQNIILISFKCKEYEHKAINCKNDYVCIKCLKKERKNSSSSKLLKNVKTVLRWTNLEN